MMGSRRTTRPSLSPLRHPKTLSWASRARPAWRSWTPEEVGPRTGLGDVIFVPSNLVSLPGRCIHQDLQPGGASGKAMSPAAQGVDPVADIEAELLWETPATHHPRGDVPDRRPLPQDQDQKDNQPGLTEVTGVTRVTGSRLVRVSPYSHLLLEYEMFKNLMVKCSPLSPPPLPPPPSVTIGSWLLTS